MNYLTKKYFLTHSPILVFLVFLIFIRAANSNPTILLGTVSHVRDGDTFLVGKIPIRLAGISAPEISQKLGKKSNIFLKQLVLGKTVRCELNGEKSYDRLIGTCYLKEDNIGKLIVKAGFAIDCPRYSNGFYKKYEKLKIRNLISMPQYCILRK